MAEEILLPILTNVDETVLEILKSTDKSSKILGDIQSSTELIMNSIGIFNSKSDNVIKPLEQIESSLGLLEYSSTNIESLLRDLVGIARLTPEALEKLQQEPPSPPLTPEEETIQNVESAKLDKINDVLDNNFVGLKDIGIILKGLVTRQDKSLRDSARGMVLDNDQREYLESTKIGIWEVGSILTAMAKGKKKSFGDIETEREKREKGNIEQVKKADAPEKKKGLFESIGDIFKDLLRFAGIVAAALVIMEGFKGAMKGLAQTKAIFGKDGLAEKISAAIGGIVEQYLHWFDSIFGTNFGPGATKRVAKAVHGFISGIIDFFKGLIPIFTKSGGELLPKLMAFWDDFKIFANKLGELIKIHVVPLLKSFMDNVFTPIMKFIMKLSQVIMKIGPPIIEAVAPIITFLSKGLFKIVGVFLNALTGLLDLFLEPMSFFKDGSIAGAFSDLSQLFAGIVIFATKSAKIMGNFPNVFSKIKTLADIIGNFGKMADPNKFKTLTSNGKIFVNVITSIGNFFGKFGKIGKILGTVGKVFSGVIKTATKVLGFATKLASEIPFLGTIISVISGLFEAFSEFFDTGDLSQSIAKGLTTILDSLLLGLIPKDMLDGLTKGLSDMFDGIGDFFVGLFTGDGKQISEGIDKMWLGIKDTLKNLVIGIVSGIDTVLSTIMNFIGLGDMYETFRTKFLEVVGTISAAIVRIKDNAMAVWDRLSTFIPQRFDEIISRVTNFFDGLKADFELAWTKIKSIVSGIGDTLGAVFSEAVAYVTGIFSGFIDSFKLLFKGEIVDGILGIVTNYFNIFKGYFTSIFSGLDAIMTKIANIFGFEEEYEKLKAFVVDFFKGFVKGVDELFQKIAAFFGVEEIYEKVKGFITALFDDFSGTIKDLVESVKTFFSEKLSWTAIVESLGDILNIVGIMKTKLGELGGKITQWIGEKLGFDPKVLEQQTVDIMKPIMNVIDEIKKFFEKLFEFDFKSLLKETLSFLPDAMTKKIFGKDEKKDEPKEVPKTTSEKSQPLEVAEPVEEPPKVEIVRSKNAITDLSSIEGRSGILSIDTKGENRAQEIQEKILESKFEGKDFKDLSKADQQSVADQRDNQLVNEKVFTQEQLGIKEIVPEKTAPIQTGQELNRNVAQKNAAERKTSNVSATSVVNSPSTSTVVNAGTNVINTPPPSPKASIDSHKVSATLN